MGNDNRLLIIFAKYPQIGKVKTRLSIGVGADCACELYESFLKATVSMSRSVDARIRLDITPDSKEASEYFERNFPGIETCFQSGDSLGDRMIISFESAFKSGFKRVCVIGSDAPDIPASYVEQAFESLDDHDCVFGPSLDGGYYLAGLSSPQPGLFQGIAWSSPDVFDTTMLKAGAAGLYVNALQSWSDVDDVYDAIRLRDRLAAASQADAYLKNLLDEIKIILQKQETARE